MASAACLVGGLQHASAQLESKQIRLIVPFPAGGPTDIVARPFAQLLSDALKATVVIDNRGGAGGSIGADVVAKAEPDGTTLIMGTVGTHAINTTLYEKLPLRPGEELHADRDGGDGTGRCRRASVAARQQRSPSLLRSPSKNRAR